MFFSWPSFLVNMVDLSLAIMKEMHSVVQLLALFKIRPFTLHAQDYAIYATCTYNIRPFTLHVLTILGHLR